MNIKESFRYQKFLDRTMMEIFTLISNRENAYDIVKTHHRKAANPEAEDEIEVIDNPLSFKNDDLVALSVFLIQQRELLTAAIGKAKASLAFDVDAAVSTNKFRQTLCHGIKNMLQYKGKTVTTDGASYKFNVAGDQVRYCYCIDVEYKEAYNRDEAKKIMQEMNAESDATSTRIDEAMINTEVEYIPPFDVNDAIEDIMEEFLSKHKP